MTRGKAAADKFHLDVGENVLASSGSRYENVQFLGSGGNATTFLVLAASGPNEGNLFALKVFRLLSNAERRTKFLNEVSFLKENVHPSIMRVFDEGEFPAEGDTYPFVVAEYLPTTLAQVPKESLGLAEKLSYTMQLLSALTFLQALNPPIVHRDIKPRNIFLKGRACVLGDFGLMKRLDGADDVDREVFKESTGPGMPYRYRTPDLVAYALNKKDLTCKSDVFQLGLVLAEIFTDQMLCKESRNALDPVKLEELPFIKGKLGGRIAFQIKRMLIEDPDERPVASDLLKLWRPYFMEAVNAAHTLDGEVFDPIVPFREKPYRGVSRGRRRFR